ncbi:MAG TPA: KGG domain-containing protein [Candidatus Nanopelagicales bacterium]|nr:KGG domain-containing protein [Candidatus Nanopelagicales bacterium]
MDDRGMVPMDEARHESSPQAERSAPQTGTGKKLRGFAAMDEARQREIASKGGKAAHEKGTAHEFTKDEARSAGKKGGEVVSQNRRHMAEIGRKGGERVSQDREHMAHIGRKGGEAVSGDRQHMAEIGRKGGESRGAGPKSQPPSAPREEREEREQHEER